MQETVTCLVIGLDGATWDLIKPWSDQGELPTFKLLMRDGVWGELKSTFHPISAQAWPAIYTGKNSGKHGIFDFIDVDSHYNLRPVSYSEVRSERLWGILSGAGKRCVVVNVPVTYPPEKINGIMVSGLMTPSEYSEYTCPNDFKTRLKQIVAKYRVNQSVYYEPGAERELLNDMHELLNIRFDLIDHFLANDPPDFLMAVIMGTDEVQHAMWKYMDRTHPLHTPEKEQYEEAILTFYRSLDKRLSSVIRGGRFKNLIMFSDHGSGKLVKRFNTNEWLRQQGYLAFKISAARGLMQRARLTKTTLMRLVSILSRLRLRGIVAFVARYEFLQDLVRKIPQRQDTVDIRDIEFGRSKAFSTGSVGRIFINSIGRFDRGTVSNEEYYELRKEIMDKLKLIKDPLNGRPVEIEVFTREDLFVGPYVDHGPDILFMMKDMEYAASRPYNTKGQVWMDVSEEDPQSASHRSKGIFVAYGQDIRKGNRIVGATVLDITPTILHMFELPAPTDLDGRILTDIFEKAEGREKTAHPSSEKLRIMGRIRGLRDQS